MVAVRHVVNPYVFFKAYPPPEKGGGFFYEKVLAIYLKWVYNTSCFPRMWTFWNKPTCHALSAFWIKTIGV